MATLRQIAANRLNARKSTGPTTEEGKAISRSNGVRHGLTGDGVVVTDGDAERVAARMGSWRPSYRPDTDEAEWLFKQMVVHSVRVDRCQREEDRLRAHLARRAALSWDDDRRLAAEELGATLSRKPALVVGKLRATRQGCDWILNRLRALAAVVDGGGEWTADQISLALDLVGTPVELRDPTAPPTRDAVGREIAGLERLRAESTDDLDDLERAAAEDGVPVEPGRPLAQLRRYEAASMRRFEWARDRLDALRPEPAPPPPAPVTQPAPREEAWRAYDRRLLQIALNAQAAGPSESPAAAVDTPGHCPPIVPAAPTARPENRRRPRVSERLVTG